MDSSSSPARDAVVAMAAKYSKGLPGYIDSSTLPRYIAPASPSRPKYPVTVLLTGSTGHLGSEILELLLTDERVERVYTLDRAGMGHSLNRARKGTSLDRAGRGVSDGATAGLRDRQQARWADKGFDDELLQSPKLVPLEGDVSAPRFGQSEEVYKEMLASVSIIVHTAWRVNFNHPLDAFEPSIKGVRALVDFAREVSRVGYTRLALESSNARRASEASHARDAEQVDSVRPAEPVRCTRQARLAEGSHARSLRFLFTSSTTAARSWEDVAGTQPGDAVVGSADFAADFASSSGSLTTAPAASLATALAPSTPARLLAAAKAELSAGLSAKLDGEPDTGVLAERDAVAPAGLDTSAPAKLDGNAPATLGAVVPPGLDDSLAASNAPSFCHPIPPIIIARAPSHPLPHSPSSTLLCAPSPTLPRVPEALISDPASCIGGGGYGQSKYVAERILAASGIEFASVRIGQVCGGRARMRSGRSEERMKSGSGERRETGDGGQVEIGSVTRVEGGRAQMEAGRTRAEICINETRCGAWATTNWFPILVKTSLALGALPTDEQLMPWLPMDVTAHALLDIVFSPNPLEPSYNLVHPRPISFSKIMGFVQRSIASTLGQSQASTAGLDISFVPFKEWMARLEDAARRPGVSARDVPGIKLIPFLHDVCAGGTFGRDFAMEKMMGDSSALRDLDPICQADVDAWVRYWEECGMFSGRGTDAVRARM